MAIFTMKDVFEFAVKIEIKGENFYEEMAQKFDQAELPALFLGLAQAEREHRETFQSMAAKLGDFSLLAGPSEEFYAYLEAYTQNLIFTDIQSDAKIAAIQDASSALLYAIDKELESVLYYQEVKNIIPASEHRLIDGIINEERNHVLLLSGMKKQING